MALRMLSGLLLLDQDTVPVAGTATVNLNPFELSAGPDAVTLTKQRTVGPARDFIAPPCRVVSAREWWDGVDTVLQAVPDMVIDDTLDTERLTISWNWSPGGFMPREISFMVVGDVGFSFGDLFGFGAR